MARAPRIDVGEEVYHVINRGNARRQVFYNPEDYQHFEQLLADATEQFSMRILAYVLMPNHWHLVLYPHKEGDLSKFMQWLTLTHTQQYHAKRKTVGNGHIYQGRYKSFLVQKDNYLLQLIRYVERNPLRAGLAKQAEEWRWGSAWRRYKGSLAEKKLLTNFLNLPRDYRQWLNVHDERDKMMITNIRTSVNKGRPLGAGSWVEKMVRRFGLGATMRGPGRPRKAENGT